MTTRSLDTETGGLDWFEPAQQAFLTTWSDERGNDHLAHQDDERGMAAFESDMRASDVLVAHNLSFDVHQLRESSGIDLLTMGKRLVDTANLARVVVPERRFDGGYKLKDLGVAYVDPAAKDSEDAMKEAAKKHGLSLKQTGGYLKLWQVEPEIVETYAKYDTRLTVELLPKLAVRMTDKLRPAWELERDVQPHLIRAEAHGVAIDQAKVQPLKASYEAKRDRAYENVVATLGTEVIGDPDDASSKTDNEALCQALLDHGVPLYRKTESGESLTTNKFALQEFAADFPVIADLQTFRTAAKFLSTYIYPMDGRNVVHTSYFQMGAKTSRMSSKNPNLQNIPVRGEGSGELREMFVPRPGYCFVVSDYDQIELRLLAHYLHSEEFKTKIERGDDVFAELAAELAAELGYADLHGTDPRNYYKGKPGAERRGDSKNTTYAISYGAGGKRITDMLGLDPGPPLDASAWVVQRGYAQAGDPSYAPARKVISMVKSWLPNYERLAGRNGRVQKKVREHGYVNSILGRRVPVNKDKAYVATNALIQSSATEIFKRGVIAAAESTAHLGALPVLFVHDEVVNECPIDAAEECRRLQDDAMRQAWDLYPSLQVSSAIAYNSYAEAK